jgi:hypothetical protein
LCALGGSSPRGLPLTRAPCGGWRISGLGEITAPLLLFAPRPGGR